MEIKTAIEIEAFGDFDVKYTECVMVHSDKINKDELLKEFYAIEGIFSNKGLKYDTLRTVTKDFIVFLELKGFSKLKTQPIYFCD